jgi:superfamily I DNA/RNA helicase/mRNA-degrading endonuclease RelE of RelBE toxin-antitoxin system
MADKNVVKVAIADDFLKAFSKVPQKQQGKVYEFINKFKANPRSPGINYEKVHQFKDQTLRSVRIDQTYRAIVRKPDSDNVFLLLWVDHHDKAYNWATNKKCTLNPERQCIQIYDIDNSQLDKFKVDSSDQKQKTNSLFSGFKDKHLIKLGVPEDLLTLVRSICTEDQFDKISEALPAEANEALTAIVAGYSLEEALREFVVTDKNDQITNVDDYSKALNNPDTKRRFFVVEDDIALQEILEAPLEQWRVFLHPSQRSLVEREWDGPVLVLGGAGTGKTVVAMHRAKWLVENVFTNENDKILLTTFTRNLAADIEQNLTKICSEKLMRRIEVTNLDRWVSSFLRKNGFNYDIDYGNRSKPLWDNSMTLAPSELSLDENFYREEWERIIQAHGITSLAEYMKISRLGRGILLSRKDRKLVWPVFEEYRLLLSENKIRESDDAMRDASALLQDKGNVLPYRSVIVDEAQDMSKQAFELIRQMISGGQQKNDIFIVGDAHQRIYRHKIMLEQCGININERNEKLKINYRTTEETRRWAVNLLEGLTFDNLDGGQDDQKGYISLLHGIVPKVEHTSSFQDEIKIIIQYLDQIGKEEGNINDVCLVARTHNLLKQYEGALKASGKDTFLVQRSEPEDRKRNGVRLATMHRVKGLEFGNVIIAGVNDGIVPLEVDSSRSSDRIINNETEVHERALLYVAATRSRKDVLVTSFEKASKFLPN